AGVGGEGGGGGRWGRGWWGGGRWFWLAGWPRPSTITGGIESENLLLPLRTSSMTPRPGGSPMATAKRSTLEPIGFQRARYPRGDSLMFSKRSAGALISWWAM